MSTESHIAGAPPAVLWACTLREKLGRFTQPSSSTWLVWPSPAIQLRLKSTRIYWNASDSELACGSY